ncbi:patatin-like phospholipase family protein [Flavobacterium sp.]|uniref:patatin-like phospholipase family protein n=1 Tax=Flavobacterium sp. TaxID=239 RepID=UPI0035276A43
MKSIILFISVFCIVNISYGQEIKSEISKPKIGLVLSGGGAKGLAHIGVLKVIDSLGIKIDYIGGTSMGSIIGGLYAVGYTGKQLDSIFRHVDTEALIQDFVPRDSKSFYEKRNDEMYVLTLPFNDFKIGLPSAFSKGLYNYNLLSKLTKSVCNEKDFLKLPTPFFCVATDIETGKEVILDKGSLPQSQIASSAIPSVFNPVEINGKLLVDGGVVNNYPVEHLRKLGAEIIIGVDVQDSLKTRKELQAASELLTQVSNLSMIEKMEKKRKLTDIYIKPNITNYNVISFEKGNEIIPTGEIAALKQLKKLQQLSTKNYNKKPKKKETDSIVVNQIIINPLKNYTRAYIIGQLKFKPYSKISFDRFEKGINNLNASQNFYSITYFFEKLDNGTENIILDLKERKSNMFLRLGVHYDNLYKSGVLLNFTKKKFIANNDVFSFDFIAGDNIRYNLNYYIDNGFYWSFGVNSKYAKFNKNIPSDFNNGDILRSYSVNSINIDYADLSNQIYFQTLFAQKYSFGLGAEHKFLKITSNTLDSSLSTFENSTYTSLFGYMKFDSFDKQYFPKKGWYFNGELKTFLYATGYTNFEQFSYLKADAGIVQTFFENYTLKLQTEGGFHVGENTVNFFDFALGGYGYMPVNNLTPFFGYDFISILGDSYVKTTFTADATLYKKHHINVTANYAIVGNKIFEQVENWLTKPSHSGYAIGYGLETIIGPVEIKHSWSPETHNHFTWISVGYKF